MKTAKHIINGFNSSIAVQENPYQMALITYALVLDGNQASMEALQILNTLATTNDNGNYIKFFKFTYIYI